VRFLSAPNRSAKYSYHGLYKIAFKMTPSHLFMNRLIQETNERARDQKTTGTSVDRVKREAHGFTAYARYTFHLNTCHRLLYSWYNSHHNSPAGRCERSCAKRHHCSNNSSNNSHTPNHTDPHGTHCHLNSELYTPSSPQHHRQQLSGRAESGSVLAVVSVLVVVLDRNAYGSHTHRNLSRCRSSR